MAAVLYGLFAVILQISGTFSVQHFKGHNSLTRPWSIHHPISRGYRPGDFHDFHVHPRQRFLNTEQNFDYQLFPSNWVDYTKDSENLISPSRLGNALSSGSSITSSRSGLQLMKHLKTLPKESRKELNPNLFLKYRPIVLKTSIFRSSKNASDGVDNLNIERSTVLYKNDVHHTSDVEDNGFNIPALHVMTSIDDVAIETPTVPEEKKEAEDGAKNDTLVVKDTRKNSMVHKEQNDSVEDKASSINIVQKEKRKNDATETKQLAKAENVFEDSPDLDESTDFKINNHTLVGNEMNETNSEVEETTVAEDGKRKTTTEVISKNTSDNSNASEDTLSTNSKITSTEEVPSNSLEETTEIVHGSSTSILNETAVPVNDSTSEATRMSSSDSSPSEAVPSTTKFPVSAKDVTDAPVSPTLSTKITDASSEDASPTSTESKFSKSEFETEATSIAPEHVIDIPSIRKAKIAISVVFLVIGLIAVAVLAVYMFRERRKAAKYDQLKLLP